MKEILQTAGAPASAVQLVDAIVDTCRVCRTWTRPGHKAVASSRLSTEFNQCAQVDLLFYKDKTILHIIDECIRWTSAELIPDRTWPSIKRAIERGWKRHHGLPTTLISDQEGAVEGEEAGLWLEQNNCHRVLRAKGQHANLVERHHEVLRQQLHKLEQQATAEGLVTDFESILAEAVLAKNSLLSVGGISPYQGLYGRQPPVLIDAERADERSVHRLRELAVQTMVEATAHARMQRAAASSTRPAGELLQLAAGDLIEFHRPGLTKDTPGWRGPAVVTDLSRLSEGVVGFNWQSRHMTARTQDVRRALMFLHLLAHSHPVQSPSSEVMALAETLNDVVRLGWMHSAGSWRECEANKQFPRALLAALHMASCNLQLAGCVGLRLGSNVRKLEGVTGADEALLLWWTDRREGFQCYHSPAERVNFKQLNRSNSDDVSAVAFIQFICVGSDEVDECRRSASHVPNLGGIHDPALPRLREVRALHDQQLRPPRPHEQIPQRDSYRKQVTAFVEFLFLELLR